MFIDMKEARSIRKLDDRVPIVTAVVRLGRALGLTVIAEGVENEVQADYLRALECNAAQGFFFARPQPADEFTQLLGRGLSAWIARVEDRPQWVA